MLVWFGVGAVGGAAAILRLLVDAAVSARTGGEFPFGTLCVNLTGRGCSVRASVSA